MLKKKKEKDAQERSYGFFSYAIITILITVISVWGTYSVVDGIKYEQELKSDDSFEADKAAQLKKMKKNQNLAKQESQETENNNEDSVSEQPTTSKEPVESSSINDADSNNNSVTAEVSSDVSNSGNENGDDWITRYLAQSSDSSNNYSSDDITSTFYTGTTLEDTDTGDGVNSSVTEDSNDDTVSTSQHSMGGGYLKMPSTEDATESYDTDDNNYESETLGESNAVAKAKRYIEYSAFSYQGLVEQLEFEGYTTEESVYGADHCGADWFDEAAEKAQRYMDYSSFSRQGLLEQLEYEGFTSEEAEYGVQSVGY